MISSFLWWKRRIWWEVSKVPVISGPSEDTLGFTRHQSVSPDWNSDLRESQTKEGSRRNRSYRHISSHKRQLRFIRGRKGHLKQPQRRLPLTRSLLSILRIPVSYLSCYVDRESYSLSVWRSWNIHYSTNHCLFWSRHLFLSSVPLRDCCKPLEMMCDIRMIINVSCPKRTRARCPNRLSGFLETWRSTFRAQILKFFSFHSLWAYFGPRRTSAFWLNGCQFAGHFNPGYWSVWDTNSYSNWKPWVHTGGADLHPSSITDCLFISLLFSERCKNPLLLNPNLLLSLCSLILCCSTSPPKGGAGGAGILIYRSIHF